MTKEIIIITLIILLIYYYYQNNQPTLASRESLQLTKDLKRQVQYYQTLYQKRVEKDLSIKKQSVEIQTDNLRDDKETQTPLMLKYSRNTQTSLSSDNVDKLITQWNQVASWAQEQGIDTNQKWNLTMLKEKVKKPPTHSRSTQTDNPDSDLENTLDNLLQSIRDLNNEIK